MRISIYIFDILDILDTLDNVDNLDNVEVKVIKIIKMIMNQGYQRDDHALLQAVPAA
jgi:hypothetical protein